MPLILISKDILKFRFLEIFLEKLLGSGYELLSFSHQPDRKPPAWQSQSFFLFEPRNKAGITAAVLLLPAFWLVNWLILSWWKRRKGLSAVLLSSPGEKLFLSLPARAAGLKNIWLSPAPKTETVFPRLLRYVSAQSLIAYFLPSGQIELERQGFAPGRLFYLPLGCPNKGLKRQENIFEKLARDQSAAQQKKFFSLAAIVELDKNQNLELLFHAIDQASSIADNLQLVVIGGGPEKQKLKWLAEKTGVAAKVWFVGQQRFLRKWLENADVYVAGAQDPGLDDCYFALYAAAAGLPLLLPENTIFEDFFTNDHNACFFAGKDPASLSQAIIELKQKPALRAKLSREAKEYIDKEHTVAKMLAEFERILKA